MAIATSERLSAAERRLTMIDAAWRLLRRHGPEGVTIDAVVGEVGVTRPMFYRHFRDRGALLAALYDDYAEDLAARTEAAIRAGHGPGQILRATFAAYLDCVSDRGPYVRAIVQDVATPELAGARVRLRDRQADLIRTALRQASVAVPPAKARLAVRLLHALALEGATAWLAGDASRREIESLAAGVIDGVLAGLAPKKAAR